MSNPDYYEFVWDDDLGCIAAAVDEDGRIVATASSYVDEQGTYTAVDESAYFKVTGSLLPAEVWDAAKADRPEARP